MRRRSRAGQRTPPIKPGPESGIPNVRMILDASASRDNFRTLSSVERGRNGVLRAQAKGPLG